MNGMFYLASQSPRRRQLLESAGLEFRTLAPDVEERLLDTETPDRAVERLAREKADAGLSMMCDGQLPVLPVMAADTMVVVDDRILGKPADRAQALAMLELLSGRTHRVLTAVSISRNGRIESRTSESFVTMKPLTRWEMQQYWASGEPVDKAGAYAIQGIGGGFVSRLEGSYSGVVGLPMFEARELLATAGISWL